MQEFLPTPKFHSNFPSWFAPSDLKISRHKHYSSRPSLALPSSQHLNSSPRQVNDPFLNIYHGPGNAIIPAIPRGIGLPRSAEQPRTLPKFLAPLQYYRKKVTREKALKPSGSAKHIRAVPSRRPKKEELRPPLFTPRFKSWANVKNVVVHQQEEGDHPFKRLQMLLAGHADMTFRANE